MIQRAAAELNYLPNQIAKSLVSRETKTIGLVLTDINNPVLTHTAQSIELALAARGYGTLFATSNNNMAEEIRANYPIVLLVGDTDAGIDAVGMEAHMHGVQHAYDKVKQALRMETERPGVVREAIQACRNGGTVSVPGVYGGLADKIPLGAVVNKALTIKSGQTHVQRYMKPLLARIENGEIDPTMIITHRIGMDDVPDAYQMFRDKEDDCIKVVVNLAS